ncbi:MAG TPA: polyprenyl synthetase family protein [Marinagarivorans sp.]|nr:polyprenyl synthetase family protein [Marinagarivorans sp.]
MLPFHNAVASDFQLVNACIIRQLHSEVGLVENIGHYLIEAGGKRLRPLLVLLVAKTLGYEGGRHIDLAAIIEFIHTATLLHDDVVDVSSLRRGRLTANAQWGNAPAVLVGDFLYSRAFQMLVELGSMEIMAILSNTTNIISEGEVQQLVNAKNPDVTEENYQRVIHKKTAALFEAACEAAAVLAGADAAARQAAHLFGQHLGMAFQLIDDALDYSGDAEALGKNLGDDLAEGKPTLPLIHAMRTGSEAERDLIRKAIEAGSGEQLQEILAIIQRTGALTYTQERAEHHAAMAQEYLTQLPSNPYAQALADLTRFSVTRAY